MKKQLLTLLGLTKRNMFVYLKDKTTVFFSMLSPVIILCLYLLFLKDNYTQVIQNALLQVGVNATEKDVSPFITSWLICGLLGTSCITVPLSSLTAITFDRENNIDTDFIATPTSKSVILFSYLISSVINTFIITGIIMTIGFIALGVMGVKLTISIILLGYFYLLLGSFSGTSVMMFIVCLFRKNSQVSAFTGIVCAASGFLIGAYMPIAGYDKWIQNIANLLPGSHVCGLFRNILMDNALKDLSSLITQEEVREGFTDYMGDYFGLKASFFSNSVGPLFMFLYTLGACVIFAVLDILLFYKTSKKN